MTPKDKAKELVKKYRDTRLVIFTTIDSIPTKISDFPTTKTAKQCALIAVDEVLDELSVTNYSDDYAIRYAYWSQVKTEIENI